MNIQKAEISLNNINNIYEIEMKSNNGLKISFLTLGASIRKIALEDSTKHETLLNLSYNSIDNYINCDEYAGMTIGPTAGRIKDYSLTIGGVHPSLIHNEGDNSLHGGNNNLSHINWLIDDMSCSSECCTLSMHTKQDDGIDGWPGNRFFSVTYKLFRNNTFQILYHATTDKDTYINMTNHTYWNMTGYPDKSLDQTLEIHSNRICINAEDHFPYKIVSSTGSCFDFNEKKVLRNVVNGSDKNKKSEMFNHQIILSKGINHGFIQNTENNIFLNDLPESKNKLFSCDEFFCRLIDPISHRSVTMNTDAPGAVIYSGGFIQSGYPLSNGLYSCPSCGIALEAQEMPTVFPYHLTTPTRPFHRMIQFEIEF